MKPHKPSEEHDYMEHTWLLNVMPDSLVNVCYVLEESAASIFRIEGQAYRERACN